LIFDFAYSKIKNLSQRITEAIFLVLSVDSSVKSRVSYGGTAPQNVAKSAEQLTDLQRWRQILARAFQVFLQGRQLRSPPRLAFR